MSFAPAKSASIAEGPGLKLIHRTLTWPLSFVEPAVRFSDHRLCVRNIGKTPTRIVSCAPATAITQSNRRKSLPRAVWTAELFFDNGNPITTPTRIDLGYTIYPI